MRTLCGTILAAAVAATCAAGAADLADFTQYVLPLMGSDSTQDFSNGNTYPAVGRPNGMHLWAIQTGNNGSGWIYAYNDRKVRGIRQTHAPSPWINDHGAWSFMPLVRDAVDETSRASWFSHKAETFEPHRLKVYLAEDDTTVELSATERAAIARIVYPKTDTPYFVVDAFGKDSCVKVDAAARRITGESAFFRRGRLPDGFKNRFVLEFDRDFVLAGGEGSSVARVKFAPTKRGEVVVVKIASSYISFDQAERNLCELGDGDFARIVEEGRAAWNERLGRICVEGALDDMRKFYTCLYRTQLFPLALHEYGADGDPVHRNPDTARVEKGVYYAGTGFWDTFRALFPLLNFVYPDVNAKMAEGLRNCWHECGWLPEWSGPGIINCMIGNNSASVVADACLTPGVVPREAAEDLYMALVHGANAVKEGNDSCGRAGWEMYNRLGFVPRDAKIAFSAARTLEYAYDDWCIWRLGVALGRPKEETDVYLKRSGNWRNVFSPEHRMACGRASDGSFDTDFDPFEWGVDFIEGCSWHYTWSVFHDVAGLAEAMGGKAAFAKKLDEVFSLPPVFCGYGGQTIHEMREMQVAGFGQYAHGNQPIQHMIYLYDWTDEPHKAQYWAREAMDRLYKPAPDGYCGDEDNGQTSAWFVWSALGMYPVCPASGEYALGTPLFEKASIHFPSGSRLAVAAPGASAERRYVKRVAHNGKTVQGNFLGSADLRGGGELLFEMIDCADCCKKEWISGGSAEPGAPAPVLVKRFNLDDTPKDAVLTLAVAGWHELYINGSRVGDDVLSPVTCQPDKRLSSVVRDVAPFLRKGDNVVEVLLGNGWFNCFTKDVWGFSSAPWLGAPKICGELVADGKRLFVTDGGWKARDSAIVFNALRNGEYYDARREGSHANVRAVKIEAAPAVAVSPEDATPCRAFDPISPVRSFPAGNGGTIYDFGSNRTGWCEIEVVGEAGAKVTIDYDECLTPTNTLLGDIGIFIRRNNDPRPAQHDEYTLAGKEGGERWHPRFAYHGFRYAQVRTEGKAELKSIKSVFVHSDFDSVGLFKISDPVFGKLQDATRRSYLSNFTGIPTDCPHREKNGWTGDAQLAMETGLWNYDAKAGYIHFLRMMIDAQKESGAVSIINPASAGWGYGNAPWPAWDAALFEIPWQIYRFYGDDAPAREAYPAMKKYLSFVGGKAREDGLVKHGLGDWCAPTGVKVAPVLLTDSAYVYEFYQRVAFWAERFGECDFAAECRAKAAKVKASFNKEFYKGGGVYAEGELTSLAAPLYFKGLCADGEEITVVGALLRRVRENGHKAKFGILGAKWIPRVLADYGYIDDAWRIFTQPDAPGWAIWMKDNDTLLESFDNTAGGTPVSHNHIMFGDLSAWAFEYLAGIKIDEPGFAKCHAEPYLPNGVDSFDISHQSKNSLVRVRAWREDGKPRYYVDTASDYIGFSKDSSREAAASGGR